MIKHKEIRIVEKDLVVSDKTTVEKENLDMSMMILNFP